MKSVHINKLAFITLIFMYISHRIVAFLRAGTVSFISVKTGPPLSLRSSGKLAKGPEAQQLLSTANNTF